MEESQAGKSVDYWKHACKTLAEISAVATNIRTNIVAHCQPTSRN